MDGFTGTVNDGFLTNQGACSWYLGHVEKPNTIMSGKYANFLNVVIYQYILNEDHNRVIVICFAKMVLHSRGIFNHLWKVLQIDRKDK